MKTSTARMLLIATILVIVPVAQLLASPGAPGGNRDAGVPIDGGISLLVAAGVAYGAKKALARKKAREEKNVTVEK